MFESSSGMTTREIMWKKQPLPRIIDEGDWSGNLYVFYYKVIYRINDDIAVPFVNRKDGTKNVIVE